MLFKNPLFVPFSIRRGTLCAHLTLRKIAIWMSKNCQKLLKKFLKKDFFKNWQKLYFFSTKLPMAILLKKITIFVNFFEKNVKFLTETFEVCGLWLGEILMTYPVTLTPLPSSPLSLNDPHVRKVNNPPPPPKSSSNTEVSESYKTRPK